MTESLHHAEFKKQKTYLKHLQPEPSGFIKVVSFFPVLGTDGQGEAPPGERVQSSPGPQELSWVHREAKKNFWRQYVMVRRTSLPGIQTLPLAQNSSVALGKPLSLCGPQTLI